MKRRRRLWWIPLACAATMALIYWWLTAPYPNEINFSQAQYDRIRMGMTSEEVQDILGRPPGWYQSSYDPQAPDINPEMHAPWERKPAAQERQWEPPTYTSVWDYSRSDFWIGQRTEIAVRFENNHVVAKGRGSVIPAWRRVLREYVDRVRHLVGL